MLQAKERLKQTRRQRLNQKAQAEFKSRVSFEVSGDKEKHKVAQLMKRYNPESSLPFLLESEEFPSSRRS